MLKHVHLVSVLLAALAAQARAVTIDTVPVGNVGNANDPLTGNLYGGVSYAYRMGTTEVTVGQYTAFLNAVGATDTYALYDRWMGDDLSNAGIARSGPSGSYIYNVIGSANKPVAYVNWGNAARFSNWLHNGQPSGAQDTSTTEDGAYTLNGATSNEALNAVTRNSGARWFIPTESEWYKAAFYKPGNNTYNQFPTSSNSAPASAPPGSTPNTANFYSPTTGYAVTGTTSYSYGPNYLTNVGAYTASASPYGTFDQGGNVWEWTEVLYNGSARGVRGGSWYDTPVNLESETRTFFNPSSEYSTFGFRVATVPEPSSFVLAALGLIGLVVWGCSKRGFVGRLHTQLS